MRSSLDFALALVKAHPNWKLFPIAAGRKEPPCFKNNLALASNDPEQITAWHTKWPGCNWGLSLKTSGMIVVDVDMKPGKSGQATFDMLKLMHGFPKTMTVRSPSGGLHYYFECVGNQEHVFALGSNGFGLDIDSPHYVLLAGCELMDEVTGMITHYTQINKEPVMPAPQWFFDYLKVREKTESTNTEAALVDLDQPQNVDSMIAWLKEKAPDAIEGRGGDQTTLKVAMHLRDHGISQSKAFELMANFYNVIGTCDPLWDTDALEIKVRNGFEYASLKAPGEMTAEGQNDDAVVAKAAAEAAAEFARDPVPSNEAPVDPKAEAAHDTIRNRDAASGGERKDKLKADIAEAWVYIEQQELFVNRETRETLTVRAFDRKFAYVQKKKLSDAFLTAKTKTARQFFSFTYAPGLGEFAVPHRYNLWRAGDVIPAPGDTAVWDAHLDYLFPDQTDRDHVLNWLAWVYQNMSRKPKHMLVVWGEHQGSGKSFIGKVFSQLLGIENVSEIEDQKLVGDFNGWARRCKLAIIEEVRNSSRTGVARALQSKITEERLMVNDKNVAEYAIDDCIAYLGFTNKADAVAMDDTDRRYLIVRTHAVPKELDSGYYQALFALLKSPVALAAIAYSMQTRDLKGYDASLPAPRTSSKLAMMDAGRSELERWVIDNLGNPPLSFKLVSISRDIIPELPAHVTRVSHGSGLSRGIADALRRFAQGEEISDIQHRLPNGERTRLWALHGSAAMLRDVLPTARVAIYLKQRDQAATRADADAAKDFGEETE